MMREVMRKMAIQKRRPLLCLFCLLEDAMMARIRAKLCCIPISGSGTSDCPRETEVAGPASLRWRLRQLVRQRSAA